MQETQWMTLLETADMMKRLPFQVTRMCEDGKLEYYMEDGRYFISRESIDLFIRTMSVGPAIDHSDSNEMPRRRYGRAPEETDPSTEAVTQTANELNQVEASDAGEDEFVGIVAEATGHDDVDRVEANGAGEGEVVGIVAEATGHDDVDRDPVAAPETAEASETGAAPETAEASVDAAGSFGHDDENVVAEEREEPEGATDDAEKAEEAIVENEAETHAHGDAEEAHGDAEEAHGDAEEAEEAIAENEAETRGIDEEEDAEVATADVTPLRESTGPVPSSQDGEPASSAMDPDDPGAKSAEILADLRAVLARHAQEHKAFCDEIAGLADALENTLSRGGDKTSELSREISSLLARYTRR